MSTKLSPLSYQCPSGQVVLVPIGQTSNFEALCAKPVPTLGVLGLVLLAVCLVVIVKGALK